MILDFPSRQFARLTNLGTFGNSLRETLLRANDLLIYFDEFYNIDVKENSFFFSFTC